MKKVATVKKYLAVVLGLAGILLPVLVFAHEVYVLSPGEVNKAVSEPSFNMVVVISQNFGQFLFWFFVALFTVAVIFLISILPPVERLSNLVTLKARKYAPFIARITIGVSLLFCAFYQATFGPELPFSSTFGPFTKIITVLLIFIGILIIIGSYTRLSALIALVLFGITVWRHGMYMLTYVNYLGEITVLLILGAGHWSIDNYFLKKHPNKPLTKNIPTAIKKIKDYLAPRSSAILRIFFGVGFIYASLYAKIIHNNLALMTVQQYHLDRILGFEAHFLVVGAALVELLIGIFFIIGFEIRFTALFLLFWLTLSLIFFGEAVWPHLMLIGIPLAYLCYGYDRYSVGWYLLKTNKAAQ